MEDKQGDEVTKNVALDDSSPLATKPGLNDEGIDVTEGSQGDDEGSHVTEGSQGDDEGIDSQGDDEGIDVTEGSQGDGTQEKTSGQVCQSQSLGEEQRDENEDWIQEFTRRAIKNQYLLGGDGLRQRRGKKSATNPWNNWITTETESVETSGIRRQAASASGNVEGEEWQIDMPPDNNDQARTQEMPNNNARNSQRLGDGALVLPARTSEESLETHGIRRQAASASGNVEGEEWLIDMPPNDQARTQEMPNNNARNSQRLGDGALVLPARTSEEYWMQSLETHGIRRQAASASGKVEGEEWPIDMPPNDQARTQEMLNNNARNSQRPGDGAPVPPARTSEES